MYELRVTAVILALMWAQAVNGGWPGAYSTIFLTAAWLLVEFSNQTGPVPTLRSRS